MTGTAPWTGAVGTLAVVGVAAADGLDTVLAAGDPLETAFVVFKYGTLAVGLAQAYAGYWIHVKRLQARGAALGFVLTVGAAVVVWGPAEVVDQWIPVGVAALVGAGIGAEVIVALHRLFVALTGFLVGVVLGVVFLTPGLEVVDPAVLASGLAMAVVAGVLHVVFVIVNTSVTGGALVALSLLLSRGGTSVVDVVTSGQVPRGPLFFGGFVAVTGVLFQLASHYGVPAGTDGRGADTAGDDATDDAPPERELDDDGDYRGIR